MQGTGLTSGCLQTPEEDISGLKPVLPVLVMRPAQTKQKIWHLNIQIIIIIFWGRGVNRCQAEQMWPSSDAQTKPHLLETLQALKTCTFGFIDF